MKIKECMSTDIVYAGIDDNISNIAKLMNEHHVGSIPICDTDKNLLGLITDRDIILRSIACGKDVNETKVKEIMTTDIVSICSDKDIKEANKIMSDNQIRRLLVVDNEKIVGILSIGDLLRNLNTDKSEIENTMECICDCKKNQ